MRYAEHNGSGYPKDPNDLNYPWLFDGVNFIVFDDFEEKDIYCRENYPNWYPEEENIIDEG